MAIQEKDYTPVLKYGGSSENTIAQTITAASTNALAVGANGTTNPVLNVNTNTGSVATGIDITGAAAASGVAVKAISSGTDENLKIDAKGAGTITINGTATGNIALGAPITYKSVSEVVTATNVILAAESGSVFFLNSATEFVSTLPAPAAGLVFTFIVTAAPSGASYTVVTASSANIMLGHILTSQDAGGSADSETSGGDTLSFVDSKAVVGDIARFFCDGTSWFVQASSKVFDAITITTAS